MGQWVVDTFVADCLLAPEVAHRLLDEIEFLASENGPPHETGIVLDGMRIGIRTAQTQLWWYSHLATRYNEWWAAARSALDANMPSCTIPIQSVHQWIEAEPDELQ